MYDGYYTYFEWCDDSNYKNNDGCSTECIIEKGWTCPRDVGELCIKENTCGDGIVQYRYGESCDPDGYYLLDLPSETFCASDCSYVEDGYYIFQDIDGFYYVDYYPTGCGDGYYDATMEVCDDGNYVNDDG